jgi:hypothetical protein
MKIKQRDLACLQAHFKVSKDEIRDAISKVGNNMDDIGQYLTQKAKPHLVKLMYSSINEYALQG